MNRVSGTRSGFGSGFGKDLFWGSRGTAFPRLGQALSQPVYADPDDRLLNLSILDILRRRALVALLTNADPWAMGWLYRSGWPGKLSGLPEGVDPVAVLGAAGLPAPATKVLFDVSQDPTSKEISDADFLDAWFGPACSGLSSALDPSADLENFIPGSMAPTADPLYTQPCLDGFFYPKAKYGQFRVHKPSSTNPNDPDFKIGEKVDMTGRFWCSPWSEGKVRTELPETELLFGSAWPTLDLVMAQAALELPSLYSCRANFFGVPLSETWGSVKPWIGNSVTAEDVLKDYPFPQPFNDSRFISIWSYYGVPGLRNLVRVPVPVDKEDVSVWITFSILANYAKMVENVNDLERKIARSERQDAIMRIVGAVIIGAIALIAALPAIIAGIASSVASAMNKVEAAKFQRDMADIQDAFKASDPAFSEKVGEAAAYVARMSQALESAIDKSTVQRTLSSKGLSTGLLIGGGLAAAGALAFALFRR